VIDNGATIPKQDSEIQFLDMFPLVQRVRDFLVQRQESIASYIAPLKRDDLDQKFGFSVHKKNNPEIILARDVAVELGHPSTASRAIILITHKTECLVNDQISVVGPDLNEMNKNVNQPFAQVVMLCVNKHNPPNPFNVGHTQYLFNRLPGYMVRSVPGKLWVRISKKSLKNGMRLETVGSALIAAYKNDFAAVESAEIVFVTQSKADVESLSQIATEANILIGNHKKLILREEGEVECAELSCETCDEKPVCDNLRDVVIKRRRQKK
jgi:CO dehydrogenase/acetyl-CoA synthase beta subunit